MKQEQPKIPLLLFAKAPIAGKVKTRLTSHCSDQQAAQIAEILIEESLKVATSYWPGKVYLSVWQYDEHPFISKMVNRYNVGLHSQVGGDLGDKMLSALDSVGYPAAIMGCDAPLISKDSFLQAHQLLISGQNVIGPSEDGGYYLIGLTHDAPELFTGINWGVETVLRNTLDLANKHAIQLTLLDEFYDIDRWADIIKASSQIESLRTYLLVQGLL